MVDTQGSVEAFADCRLGGADVEHREPAVWTYLVILATEHLSNPLNGSGQVRLTKVLKPVDREVLLSLSWYERCGQR